MKIFLDTANVAHISKWANCGLIDGVTTNPTLISKEKGEPKEIITHICSIMGKRPVSIEVTHIEPELIYQQAHALTKIANNVVVKIPADKQYLDVISRLVSDGIPLNITLVCNLFQGLAMCKLGVQYISPFIGRIDDLDGSGATLLKDLIDMKQTYGFATQVLAASIRTILHIQQTITLGADCITIPVELLEKAIEHPLTKAGIEKFMADWNKLGIKIFP